MPVRSCVEGCVTIGSLSAGWWWMDPYIVALPATVAVASLLPARGIVATGFDYVTTTAIGVLFFLYGARCRAGRLLTGCACLPEDAALTERQSSG